MAWSLCVEAAFYVLLPALAAGLGWLGRGAPPERALRREIVALLALAAMSIALQATAFAPSSGLVRSTLPVFMDWFALGMIFAVLSVLWHRRQSSGPSLVARRPGLIWLAALILFWATSTQLGLPRNAFNGISTSAAVSGHVFQGLCAARLLAPALFGDNAGGLPRRLLANRALAWCGLVSYGVFLYHRPLIAKLREAGAETWIPGSRLISLTVVATAVSLALAAASYYVLERPRLRLKDRRARRAAASPAAVGAEDTPSALVRG